MKIVVISTFWNAEKYVSQCVESLKKQYFTDFIVYMIDDLSTDNSYEVAKNAIGDDERFILIRNEEKKYKTKSFVDVISNNDNIDWDDVIVEIDGDDSLIDNFVLGLINKIYSDSDIWICGSKWIDQYGRTMNYGRANADNPRSLPWNFSQMRTYRAFLFRSINLEDLKYDGEYYKAACDLGHGMPMLEMAGNEHYYFLDKITYLYNWHDHQSYSNNNSAKDKNIQAKTAKHIYSLPRYEKINLNNGEFDIIQEIKPLEKQNQSVDVLLQVFESAKYKVNTSKSDINKKREYINTFNRFTPPKKTKRK